MKASLLPIMGKIIRAKKEIYVKTGSFEQKLNYGPIQ